MRLLKASAPARVHIDEELTHFGVGLNHARLPYLAIAINAEAREMFGHHHYVEMGDQGFGENNGLEAFSVSSDGRSISFKLSFDVGDLGRDFTIESADPMDADTAEWARGFSTQIAARS